MAVYPPAADSAVGSTSHELSSAAAASSSAASPTSDVVSPAFIPAAAPGLSVLTSYSPNPAPLLRTESVSSLHSAASPVSPPAAAEDEAADVAAHRVSSGSAAHTAIDVSSGQLVSPYSASTGSIDPYANYLSSPVASPPTTSPLQLTISFASPPLPPDSLALPSTSSNSTSHSSHSSSSHLIDIPPLPLPPHSPAVPQSREHSVSLSHQHPSVSVRRLSVSQRSAPPNGRSQEDEEELRWLTQANPFDMAAMEVKREEELKVDDDDEAAVSDEYDAAETEEKEAEEEDGVAVYEASELKLPPPPTHQLASSPQPSLIVHPINQTSLLPPTAYAIQRITPVRTSPSNRPSIHHTSQHISLSYDPRSQSQSSIPQSPSPTPSLSAAASITSEQPPSPALLIRPLIYDDSQDRKTAAISSSPTSSLTGSAIQMSQMRLSPADRRRLQKKIGFALAEHDEDVIEDEEVSRVIKPELRPVKPLRRSAKQREAERKEKERRKRQHEKDILQAKEQRFLARDIQERVGSFPRPLLQAVLSCLLTSPPVATLSNLSSSYALTSGQHVLLDLSGLAGHWSGAESSLPDELAHALSVLLGLKAGVLVCNERTSMRDMLYERKEDREEKYGGGGLNGGRGSALSIASMVSSSSTSSPSAPTGPLFSHIVVLHNLHLAPHSLHSTLISAGRLGSVTIDGSVVRLPRPSLLVATHSQHTGGGLWCGGSGFSARQLMELFMYDVMAESTFPSQLRAYLAQQPPMPPSLSSRTTLDYNVLLPPLQSITCSHLIRQYVHDLIVTLRQHVRVAFGPSPSTAHSLLCAASTHALFSGVGYVTPHDVDVVSAAVLAHRITLRMMAGGSVGRGVGGSGAGAAGSARAIVQHLVTKVLVPPK